MLHDLVERRRHRRQRRQLLDQRVAPVLGLLADDGIAVRIPGGPAQQIAAVVREWLLQLHREGVRQVGEDGVARGEVDVEVVPLGGPGTAERLLLCLRIEGVQQVRAHLDVEQHLRRDAVRRPPGEPVLRVHPDLKVDEAGGERSWHPVDHAPVALPVAAGDQRGAFRQLVFAYLAVEHQLVERGLYHRHGRGQLLQVDEPAAGIAGGRQEGRRRPACAAVRVAPGDAAQVDGVEQQRAHVDVAACGLGGGLLGERALGTAWSSPKDSRLAGFDQQRQGRGELARA